MPDPSVVQAMNRSTLAIYFSGPGAGYSITQTRLPFLPHCWPEGTHAPFWLRAEVLMGEPGTYWGPFTADGKMRIGFSLYGFPAQSGTLWTGGLKLLEIPPNEVNWSNS